MLGLALLIVTLGLADSLNPLTLAVAVALAASGRRRALAGFIAGVFAVYLAGGALLLFGPGQLLHGALAGAHSAPARAASVLAGALLVLAAVGLALRPRRVDVEAVLARVGSGSSLLLGATVTAIDLPTAFPYFTALAAIAGSELSWPAQAGALAAFNALYVAPLLAVAAGLAVAPRAVAPLLARVRGLIARAGSGAVAALTGLTGAALLWQGARGLL